MRMTLNGNLYAVLLIGIGATKCGVIKGYIKQRQERCLSVSKHDILEDDELSEHAESDAQSGKEIAGMLRNMPHEKLLEVVLNCPASMLQQFMANVTAPITAAVVSIPAGFLWVARQTPERGTRPKRRAVFKVSVLGSHVGSGSAETDIFCILRPRPLLQVLWQVQASGSAVFFSWIQLSLL